MELRRAKVNRATIAVLARLTSKIDVPEAGSESCRHQEVCFVRNIDNGIRVRAPDGREYLVYQIDVRDPIPVSGTIRHLSRFETDTGEQVRHVDDHTFVLSSTGETLERVRPRRAQTKPR